MTTQLTSRRVLRREARSSRTLPAVVFATALLLVLLIVLGAGVAGMLDPGARLTVDAVVAGAAMVAAIPAVAIGAGLVATALAAVLLALAFAPGRRARRARLTPRSGVVVDDGVLADAIADGVARRTGVPRGRVSVTIGRRTASVRITPTSGVPVDPQAGADAATAVLAEIGFALAPRVHVAREGVIG